MKGGSPSRGSSDRARRDAAVALAIAALGFLASDPEQLGDFLAATGIGPERIREVARDPHFLAGVLDHLASDERLVVAFARNEGVDPAEIGRARATLASVWEPDLP
jgi:hypothetical protein